MISPAGHIASTLGAMSAEDVMAFLLIALAVIALGLVLFTLSRFHRCPTNRVMVIYGTNQGAAGAMNHARFVRGGATFVWPMFQAYDYLDLEAFSIATGQISGPSRDNVPVSVSINATAGISPQPGWVERAAGRLLGLTRAEIHKLVGGILVSRARAAILDASADELRLGPRGLRERIGRAASETLGTIGIELIDLDVHDLAVRDEETPAALTPDSQDTTPQARQDS